MKVTGMAKKTRARVTGERYIDLDLWFTATYLLGIARRRRKGQAHPFLAASVFAFFAFEAYLNEVGRRLCPDEWSREREFFAKGKYQGTVGKFRYLARKVNYSYAPDRRPFQTVRELAKTRDLLAHGRVETYDFNTAAERADAMSRNWQPKVMALAKAEHAKRAIADVQALADGLMAAAKTNCGEWAAGYRSSAFVGVTHVGSIGLEG
jgi:hypothetical protein